MSIAPPSDGKSPIACARLASLTVWQRVSALRPVARSVDHRSAVVGSQLGMSSRYIWQRLGLSTFP